LCPAKIIDSSIKLKPYGNIREGKMGGDSGKGGNFFNLKPCLKALNSLFKNIHFKLQFF
jgi:hypothetical protein